MSLSEAPKARPAPQDRPASTCPPSGIEAEAPPPPRDQALILSAIPALVPQGASLGLAVSGGSDSMALLHLSAQAAKSRGITLEVATVDHRLRPEAASEAVFVAQICAELGLSHRILVWQDHPPTGNVMAQGALARYALLAAWAQERAIAHITLAHTADDQAEGFLIGLSRGSGLEGLCGMRPAWQQAGVQFLRPLLGCARDDLRAYLRARGLTWCEDPSNQDDRYTRARMRKALPALSALGITPERLVETIRNLATVRGLLSESLADWVGAIGEEQAGSLVFERAGFDAGSPELQRRLVIAAIRWLASTRHPPRASSVAALLDSLDRGEGGTLGGARFRLTASNLRITREPRAAMGPVPLGQIWDGRWQITGPTAPGHEIRALGPAGLAACKTEAHDWRQTGFSRDQLLVTPAVWHGAKLVAAPFAGLQAGQWHAKTVSSFGMFVLSH